MAFASVFVNRHGLQDLRTHIAAEVKYILHIREWRDRVENKLPDRLKHVADDYQDRCIKLDVDSRAAEGDWRAELSLNVV